MGTPLKSFASADRADRLTRAAIDAGVGGDTAQRDRLLSEAEAADPDCPRLCLERIKSDLPPNEQLARLEEIHTDDDSLRGVIACHKALASLLIPDLDRAGGYVAEAEALDPGSMSVRSTAVNVRVQRARIALTTDRTFSLAEATSAEADALALRDDLIAMSRWDESGSLLMLAADIRCPARCRVSRKVSGACAARRAGYGSRTALLGDAALRSGAPELALRFVKDAQPSDATTRIRATAEVDFGGRRRAPGLATLENLATSESAERDAAALARLLACLPPFRLRGANRLRRFFAIPSTRGRCRSCESSPQPLPETSSTLSVWQLSCPTTPTALRCGFA